MDIVTFVTKPEPIETLNEFYKRVKPWGWWKPVSDLNPDIEKPRFTPVLVNWVLGVSFILFGMMGTERCYWVDGRGARHGHNINNFGDYRLFQAQK